MSKELITSFSVAGPLLQYGRWQRLLRQTACSPFQQARCQHATHCP